MKIVSVKKIILGTLLTDGCLDTTSNRYNIFNKNKEFIDTLSEVLHKVPGIRFTSKAHFDKRYNKINGYKLWSTKHPVLSKIFQKVYPTGRKVLNSWSVSRLNDEALAWAWMCDGYLEHAKNKQTDKVQNIGWFCLESFPQEELKLLVEHLQNKFNITSTLSKVKWGFGFRVRIGGESLQRFISLIYPYILPCFKYKTVLFYKRKDQALQLPNAEQYLESYSSIEDIVRHPTKVGKT